MRTILLIFSVLLLVSCENEQDKRDERSAIVWKQRLQAANARLKTSRERDACFFCHSIRGGCVCSDQDQLAYHSYMQYAKYPDIKQKISLVVLDPNTSDVKAVQSFMANHGQAEIEEFFKQCTKETKDELMPKTCENTINNL